MTTARLCVLVVLLWTPGDAFEATNRPTKTTYTSRPIASLATIEPPPLYYTWAIILSCVMLFSAGILFVCICLLRICFGRPHLDSVKDFQGEWILLDEVEAQAQSLEALELLESPFSPDVEPWQGEIQEPPPSPIVLVHRAQNDGSEDETAPGALVHRNITRQPLQPDSDTREQ